MKMTKSDHPNGVHLPAPRRKILLLDDDVDLCDVLRTVLEWRKYDVTVVHRGVDGVRAIMMHDFDAIVCDMMMPTMRGDMFYVAVQQLKPHLCRRFIFITAHQGNPEVDFFLRLATGQVLYKPLATDQLIAKITDIIANTNPAADKIVAAVRPKRPRQKPVLPRHSRPSGVEKFVLIAAANRQDDPACEEEPFWLD